MKLRLLKEWNGKAPGKVGVFLSEYGEQLVKDGIRNRFFHGEGAAGQRSVAFQTRDSIMDHHA